MTAGLVISARRCARLNGGKTRESVNHVSSFFRRISGYRLFPHPGILWEAVIILACFFAFTGLTTWFVAFEVNQSQHKFCELLISLTSVKPPPGNPGTNPSRAYNQQIAADLITLKRSLGC